MTFNISIYESKNLESFEHFDKCRSANVGLLSTSNGIINYNEISKDRLRDGVSVFQIDGVQFHCFSKIKTNYQNKIYVLLSGGRSPGGNGFVDKLPRFKRWSFYPSFDGHVFVFDDPMYFKHSNLSVGWFYGTEDQSYVDLLTKLVSKIAKELNCIEICFYGSSSGGFAALHAAAKLDKTRAIAINPQLILGNDWYANRFKEITGINLTDKDKFNRNDLSYLMGGANSKFVIVQNITDGKTVREHFVPFCRKKGLWPKYGISEQGNLKTFVFNAPGGHVSYENKRLLPFILKLAYPDFDSNEMFISLADIWSDYKQPKVK